VLLAAKTDTFTANDDVCEDVAQEAETANTELLAQEADVATREREANEDDMVAATVPTILEAVTYEAVCAVVMNAEADTQELLCATVAFITPTMFEEVTYEAVCAVVMNADADTQDELNAIGACVAVNVPTTLAAAT
jgi:hypothetical protein